MLYDTKIIVPFRNLSLILSINEAERLHEMLSEKLDQRKISSALRPPEIKDGYISREAIYEFFSQMYEKPNLLRQHAGKLHARLMNAAWYGTISLETHCKNCHGEIRARSCMSTSSSHMSEKERRNMEISIASLKKLSIQEFKTGTTKVGPAIWDDFELLRNNL